ncbi:MAG: class I SAM-dependent methyltransferase, partial [Actinomycetes bacterium]
MATTEAPNVSIQHADSDHDRDALVERLVESATASLEMFSIFLGRAVGAYQALADAGSAGLTIDDLAKQCDIHPRYAREWLEQQTVAGLLRHAAGSFSLPAGYAAVLVDPESPAYVAPLAELLVGISGVLPRLPAAYRAGTGVPYADYGPIFRGGQGAMNRPAFADVADWLATMPDVRARLDNPGAAVADLGCGEGWSTIALARALPQATIHGFDLDEASVVSAREHVAASNVGDRINVSRSDGLSGDAAYDLILIFEALHDLARPTEVLRAAHASLPANGVVLVGDERVADEFGAANGDLVERMMYGWSVVHCLPASLADAPSDGLGTVLRRS